MRKFLRAGTVYGLTQGVTSFIQILSVPIYIQFLNPSEYGLLEIYTSLLTIISLVLEMEMVSAVARFFFEARRDSWLPELLGTSLTYYVAVNILALGILFVAYPMLAPQFSRFSPALIIPIVLNLFPYQIFNLAMMLIRLDDQPKSFALMSVTKIVLTIVFGLFAVVKLGAGPSGLLWSSCLAGWISAALAYVLYLRRYPVRYGFHSFRKSMAYCSPLMLIGLSAWGIAFIDRYFLAHFMGLSTVGAWGLMNKASFGLLIATTAFRYAYDPYQTKKYIEPNSEPFFARALNLYLFSFFVYSLFIIIISPIAIHLVAPRAYWEALPWLGFLIVGHLWNGSTIILCAGNVWDKTTYWNFVGTVVGLAVSIVLTWFGIPKFGLLAVAAAFFLGMSVKALLFLWTGQKCHPIPYRLKSLFVALVASVFYATFFAWVMTRYSENLKMLTALQFLVSSVLSVFLWYFVLEDSQRSTLKVYFLDLSRKFLRKKPLQKPAMNCDDPERDEPKARYS